MKTFKPGFHEAVDPGLIDPSPHQNRIFPKHWEQQPENIEFIASIRAIGVKQPILCRPHPGKPGRLMLVAGERRLRATRAAGRDGVPAMVEDLTDAQAANVTVSENHHRQDLTAVEEAHGVATLLRVHGGDARAVASQLGQTERWVRLRAKLTELIPEWQEVTQPGEHLSTWSAAHLALIARFDAETQKDFLDGQARFYSANQWSVDELERQLADYLMLLRKAPWKLDDEALCPDIGSCEDCSQRTDHDRQQGLFDDEEADPEVVAKNARCMDRACWQGKAEAFLKQAVAQASHKYDNLVLIQNDRLRHNDKQRLEEAVGSILGEYDWDNSKKSAPGALPALVVHGKGLGTIRWVKLHSAGGGSSRPIDPATGKARLKPLAQRRAELDSKRWCQVLVELRERLDRTTIKEVSDAVLMTEEVDPLYDTYEALTVAATLAMAFGTNDRLSSIHAYDRDHALPARPWEPFGEAIAGWPDEYDEGAVAETLWRQVAQVLQSRLNYTGPITQLGKDYIEEARQVGKLIGVDVEALHAEIATRKGFTEPKSWASLAADGTPKKAAKGGAA